MMVPRLVLALALTAGGCATTPEAEVRTGSSPSPVATDPTLPPDPARPAAYDGWLRDIPADFSVSAGLPDDGGDFVRVTEAVTGEFCGTEAFPLGEALDTQRDGATGPEYADRRDLRLFADDRAAHDFLEQASAVAADCPEEPHGATRWRHSVVPVDGLGEEAVRIVQTYETDGLTNVGATWWLATRVGNAVLLTGTGGEYFPGQTLGHGIRQHDRLIAPVVESLCAFGVDGCSEGQLLLRHDGVGPLRLGMTAAEAAAVGAEVTNTQTGTGCQQLSLELEENRVTGDIDPSLGVSMLWASGAVTPEGIGGLSSWGDVRDAYPDVAGDEVVATVRASDVAHYRLELHEGVVDSIMLVADGQGCAS